jgi:hypothetical protein
MCDGVMAIPIPSLYGQEAYVILQRLTRLVALLVS